ncbi:hypothetical protein LEP1GSC193_4109 [Leptospira alstonii serovar Pingchang str. 80-412]|uniref:Uncharacterized protein n=2 Tax=Leptospira alstonii TaxID=28452 RepID=M6D780_9LEPT|nr:hypothetical protein LEP1GSC194_2217 [Leptospira alstonii serovar Sichuan str. 79601]EQA78450.1 hypothetical protein LEP1GSC193_4109 [Leptospira alstonii serovar Pingchang str. 80-412]
MQMKMGFHSHPYRSENHDILQRVLLRFIRDFLRNFEIEFQSRLKT